MREAVLPSDDDPATVRLLRHLETVELRRQLEALSTADLHAVAFRLAEAGDPRILDALDTVVPLLDGPGLDAVRERYTQAAAGNELAVVVQAEQVVDQARQITLQADRVVRTLAIEANLDPDVMNEPATPAA